MGQSARVLGWEFGRSAREMNALFKEHGYLEGEPGAYGLTEKGAQYAAEQYHHAGTGGYSWYNRDWETRSWNDDTAAALRADIDAARAAGTAAAAITAGAAVVAGEDVDPDDGVLYTLPPNWEPRGEDDDPGWVPVVIAGVVVGAALLAPHVKPFYTSTVKPAAQRLKGRLTKRATPEEPTDPANDDQ